MPERLRPFTASSLPYAPLHLEGRRVWLVCPRCRLEIDLVEAKDENSFSFIEHQTHYLAEHAAADGLIERDGAWFHPAPLEPRRSDKGW